MNKPIEQRILEKSHSPERAKELLETRFSLSGDQKPILVLTPGGKTTSSTPAPESGPKPDLVKHNGPWKKSRKSKDSRRQSARQGLQQFIRENRDNVSYQDFVGLNELWKGYINDLRSGASGVTMAAKLASADYIGAEIKVVSCRNPSVVGITGICIWDARSCYVLVTKADKMKVVQKQGARFEVVAGDEVFELIGSRIMYRAADRSDRKFKPRSVDDL